MNPITRNRAGWIGAGLAVLLIADPAVGAKPDDEAAEEVVIDGVLIGDFMFRGIRGAEGVKTRLSFSLYAAVDNAERDQFERVLEQRRHRIREQVITAIRLTKTSDLQEPSLARLKRRILMRLRRTSPGLPIHDLHFRQLALMFD